MISKPWFVFNTNVLVDAVLFSNSFGRKSFEQATKLGRLVVSLETLGELTDVLLRSRFDKFSSKINRILFLETYQSLAYLIEPAERIAKCRDPNDDKFLEVAVASGATALITRDLDLLVLHPFRKTSIVTPKDFVESMEAL